MTPPELKYTREHEWARAEAGVATVGITDFAQEQLSDVVFVELPEVGRAVRQLEAFGTIEAVKTVSELYAPVSGEIVAVNDALVHDPGRINRSPYEEGWIVKIRMSDPAELERLLDADAYQAAVQEA
jgi:glycine cleavage system H protein